MGLRRVREAVDSAASDVAGTAAGVRAAMITAGAIAVLALLIAVAALAVSARAARSARAA